MIQIYVPDVSRILARYEAIFDSRVRQDIIQTVGRALGVAAESVVSEYPPPSRKPLPLFYDRTDAQGRPYKSKFKSIRQQRYVMALARRGKIPYRRTGQLGRSITSDVRSFSNREVIVAIGTRTTYAPFVIGQPPQQSHYHQGTWTPLMDDLRNNYEALERVASNTLIREIERRLK